MGGASWSPSEGKASGGVEKPELVRNPAPPKPADEHLQMVPLSGDKTGTYETAGQQSSATSFFAIPGSNKRDSDAPPKAAKPVAAGPIAGPVPAAPVPSAPIVMGPQPVGGIAGPVAAAGGVGAAPGMGMPGGGFDPHAIQEQRSSSGRVFAVVALLVAMVCGALVVSIGLLVFAVVSSQQEQPLELPAERPTVVLDRPKVDTGLNVEKTPTPTPTPTKRTRPRPRSNPAPNPGPRPAPAAAPAPAAPSGPSAGTVTVIKPSNQFYTQVEVRCGPGFRVRQDFQGDTATVPNVPAEACLLTFKGGAASPKITLSGAGTYRCSGDGAAMGCSK